MLEKVKHARHELLEACVEHDDVILHKYLEGQELTEVEVRTVVRKATVAGHVVPVLCGAAFKNKGIQPLLDAVIDYLPSPADVPPIEGLRVKHGDVTDEKIARPANDDGPFAALAFKIATDPYVGHLTYFRVYSGSLTTEAGVS